MIVICCTSSFHHWRNKSAEKPQHKKVELSKVRRNRVYFSLPHPATVSTYPRRILQWEWRTTTWTFFFGPIIADTIVKKKKHLLAHVVVDESQLQPSKNMLPTLKRLNNCETRQQSGAPSKTSTGCMHYKAMAVDRVFVCSGSCNYTYPGLGLGVDTRAEVLSGVR